MSTSLINTEILPFKASAFHAGQFVEVTNATLKGKWSVVFFYPADFTFVCPTELGDLADNYATFQQLGVEIYAVSTDTHFTHKAWHDTSDTIGKINYPMIGDPTGQITRNFGVMIEEAGLAERGTFGAAAQGQGCAVCRQPPGRSLPGEMAGRRQDAGSFTRSGRQDLIVTAVGAPRRGCVGGGQRKGPGRRSLCGANQSL